MKTVLFVILVFHGLIHLFGFAKAFSLAPLGQLKERVSKPNGILWLGASASYLLMALLLFVGNDSWSILSIVAIPISQFLIFTSWRDARWGSLFNIVILAAAIINYGSWRFNSIYKNEVRAYLVKSSTQPDSLLSEFDLVDLPKPVQKY